MGLIEELQRFRIIDMHVHNWSLFADTAYLVECLDRFELDALVILSNLNGGQEPSAEQVTAANEATLRLRDHVGERIIPFAYVNAQHTDNALQQVAWCASHDFRGLKYWISQRAVAPCTTTVTEAALEHGWPVLYHSYFRPHGEPPAQESPPGEIAELARRFPQGQFIMAHMGAQFEHGLAAVADCPNVAVDYAGSINEKGAYETAIERLGPERVLFGTDMPACFYTNAGRVLELDVDDAVKQMIFADNLLAMIAS
ncbi:MAG: amidohydrolase [Lentisphaerae bacterium]|jgi:uncharacterized protein|nr:amidohydrolase [Lentisphaerota bacterium]MBT4814119.1 amidohydrolase [Lentisphaerota bacterium]MBT5606130.1 amidohydrolase [Lentisphaerota bacterium]MBT7060197.1 amidohydrolase [Lentisphaerota bacterium]MBT7840419.1 amidohydrolase [Lentisphaerota bacterium]